MSRDTSSHRSRPRLFANSFFESFTFFPLKAFLVIWPILLTGIAAVAIISAPTLWALPVMVGGWLAWTITEYALHRFVFHLEPESTRLQQIVFVIHGNHHTDPNDPLRNLMPPIVSVPIASLIWFACVALMGPIGHWFFLGFIVGYVIYDLLHYACHQFPMTGRLARILKVHHMRHHFDREGVNYAITGMIWDRLFWTKLTAKGGRR